MKTLSGRHASQNEEEISAFIALLRREAVASYLEIGARQGDTFHDVMMALPERSFGVAVDLPGGNWGVESSAGHLRHAASVVRSSGRRVDVILGNSGSPAVEVQVADRAPYDAALIDGDHLYEGVKSDWETFRPMARIVAFHDIVGDGVRQRTSGLPVEVPRLWREIKGLYRHVEIVAAGSTMGIGVVWT